MRCSRCGKDGDIKKIRKRDGICYGCLGSMKRFEEETMVHYIQRFDNRVLDIIKRGKRFVPPFEEENG